MGYRREMETKKEEEKCQVFRWLNGPLQKLFLYRDTSQEEKFVPDNIDAHAIKLLLEVLHADALRLMTTLDQAQNLHKDHNS